MIQFFKINDPFRILGIVVVLLLFRIAAWIGGIPLIHPELGWMVLGEKMGEGLTLYRDIDDNTGPLAAGVYWLIDTMVGRSQAVYQFVGTILVLGQAILFNFILNRTDVMKERTYLSALFYVVFSSIFYDFFTVSPVLMALTFVLLGFGYFFNQLKQTGTDYDTFNAGFFIGVSALFYFPFLAFMLLLIAASLFFTSMSPRRYMTMLFGFALPLICAGLYFYWVNGIKSYLLDVLFYAIGATRNRYVDVITMISVLALPVIFLVTGMLRLVNLTGFVNYQQKCQKVMVFWVVIGIFTLLLTPQVSLFHFYVFVPVMAFFVANQLIIAKKRRLTEVYAFVIIGVIGFTNLKGLGVIESGWLSSERLKVDMEKSEPYGRVLVFGSDISQYAENKMATRFLNWHIAKSKFLEIDQLNNISYVYTALKKDPPDAIIDQVGVMEKLVIRIPELQGSYESTDGQIWVHNGNFGLKVDLR